MYKTSFDGSCKWAAPEAEGNKTLARRLNAATRLRLIMMLNDEVWQLAGFIAASLGKPVDPVFQQFKESIMRHRLTSVEWISDLIKECSSGK